MNFNSTILAKELKATTTCEWVAKGITIDTRNITTGNIFIALAGSNFNGHDFVKEAIQKGAAAAIVEAKFVTEELKKYPLLIVNDTKQALIDLAKLNRKNFKGKIIGVTGSVGKTSTKDMLFSVLSSEAKVYASYGNFNNDIGLPLCLANLSNDYDIGIFELGMNKPQEIISLTKILEPHIAIITEVASVHSAFFNNLQEIATAKLEIIEGLIGDKILILPHDNELYSFMYKNAKQSGITNIYSFGKALNYENVLNNAEITKGDIKLISSEVNVDENQPAFSINQSISTYIDGNTYNYNINALGEHHGILSLIVMGVASLLGFKLNNIKNAFLNYEVRSGRGKITREKIDRNHETAITINLIDDSYNASPLSMQKSILMLNNFKGSNRKILILGDMLEIDKAEEIIEHLKLKQFILEVKPNIVFTLGPLMRILAQNLSNIIEVQSYNDYKVLAENLINYVHNNDIVLIKGSYGSLVMKVAEIIKTTREVNK
ncbi:UDP-N-acetylmuramoyl-tripeptide--D-alanyl-D-alanine ligase [Rickettsiales bacterium LUAb2]